MATTIVTLPIREPDEPFITTATRFRLARQTGLSIAQVSLIFVATEFARADTTQGEDLADVAARVGCTQEQVRTVLEDDERAR